jgi:DNA-binding transcriptional regulator YiaG
MMTADQIRKLRKKMNLFQEDLAAKIGVTPVTLSRWETGKFKPSHLALEKLESLRAEMRKKGQSK